MDRLTPFAAADLFWTWAVEARDRRAGLVRFRLSLVPRSVLEPALQLLDSAGLRPVALDGAAADGTPRRLALAPVRQGWWGRHGLAALGCACAVLAAVAAGLPFLAQDRAMRRTEARIAALRPQVNQAEALRAAVQGRAATADAVQAGRARVGDALGVLAELTAALPDDTYLTELTLRGRVLGIAGKSAAAARLITVLSAEPGFKNPTFAAPVTRVGAGTGSADRERFSIRAEVTH